MFRKTTALPKSFQKVYYEAHTGTAMPNAHHHDAANLSTVPGRVPSPLRRAAPAGAGMDCSSLAGVAARCSAEPEQATISHIAQLPRKAGFMLADIASHEKRRITKKIFVDQSEGVSSEKTFGIKNILRKIPAHCFGNLPSNMTTSIDTLSSTDRLKTFISCCI